MYLTDIELLLDDVESLKAMTEEELAYYSP